MKSIDIHAHLVPRSLWKAVEEGRVMSHAQAKQRMARWLK